ncbi:MULTISPECIES: phage baseplate assembly protein V [unclassified Mesorhizobium]|uniref:phage baseplate assembly protein V n=1 Tax=unclassified Mesorhizobium TaxID=325217 RepID=UPI002415628F|nr:MULTISPECIES: phage baseplate assembly protein V [unclassified Mesorhizobium]MDG4854587.1 phage baseplate assembly protein V [Mesorhizobium sp. WSM4982]MDG4916091.1 phage baseplate assembly protein V [Mesorhizobium sp. WSM4983]
MHDPELVKVILGLQADIAALKRMVAGNLRFGTVKKVDHDAKRVQLLLSEANGREFLSPWRPWGEIAGNEKSWRPPTQGQQMMLVAPHGDMRQGIALPMTFSDQNPAPSSDSRTRILSTFGGATVLFDAGGERAELSASRVDLGAAGGKRIARVGDRVHVMSGSSTGFWPIVEGSSKVFAAD